MQAIIYNAYGSPEVLKLVDRPVPIPHKGEVLIKVKAISLNPRDSSTRNGDYKLFSGHKFPKLTGADFAGSIAGIGDKVKSFKVGDEVFGYIESLKVGSSAQFVVLPEKYLAIKPEELSYEQAAALGCAYLTALQSLRDKGNLKAGDKVAIYGASGGVGLAALQLAKYFGASSTAISNSDNESLCKSQGADSFIAYDKADVFSSMQKFDVFFQVYSKQGSFYNKAKHLLHPTGTFICLIPSWRDVFKLLYARPRLKLNFVKSKKEDLEFLVGLASRKLINPYISKHFKLAEMVEAHKMIGSGHVNGKITISL